jgi:hypothetical protein
MKRHGENNSIYLPYLLIFGAALLRLMLSNTYNAIPVFSCILVFGAKRPKREFPIALLALIGVDIFLTTHRYGYSLTSGDVVTWIWYLGAMTLSAATLGNSISTWRVLQASLLVTVSFFAVSNYAVWAAWGMYPKTWSGLGTCYVAALPFFRNSIVSETVFSLLIFSFAHYCEARVQALSLLRDAPNISF